MSSARSTLQKYWRQAKHPAKVVNASKLGAIQRLTPATIDSRRSTRSSLRNSSEEDASRALKRLVSVERDLAKARTVYRAKLYAALVHGYELALIFKLSSDDWLEFCRHPLWQSFKGRRPIPSDRSNTLRFVLRFLAGFNGAAATRRANQYFTALEPAFEDDLPPAKLPLYIRNGGGIVALSRSNKRRK